MAAALPTPPSIDALRGFGLLPGEIIELAEGQRVWRVHRTVGEHVLAWNAPRTFGPVLRFDHHPPPRDEYPAYGIWYGAGSPRGALAEAFQSTRVIDPQYGAPFLTGFRFTRSLSLLDVSGLAGGVWATRVGANHAIDSAPYGRSQHWARTIHRAYLNLDGVAYRGRFADSLCLALFERASATFPARPDLALPLWHPELADPIATAAQQLGYTLG